MDTGRGLAWTRAPILGTWNAATHRMIEDKNPIGTSRLFEGVLGLRIIDRSHLIIVVEVLDGALLLQKRKSFPVQLDRIQNGARIANGNNMWLRHSGAPRFTLGR